jgi:hypothetical protein
MSNKIIIRKKINSRVGIAAILAAILAGLWYGSTAAIAGNFVEPPVFASAKGVLDLLMIATPPIPRSPLRRPWRRSYSPYGVVL